MAEWLKAHAWKACLGETLTWVRIPPSPPYSLLHLYISAYVCESSRLQQCYWHFAASHQAYRDVWSFPSFSSKSRAEWAAQNRNAESYMGMKAALKTRDDLVQVEILMREQGLRTETRLKLILARARLKWQLLAVEMREQLRVPPS